MNAFKQVLNLYLETEFYSSYEEGLKGLELLRESFVKTFPIEEILEMDIDDYVVGKKNENGDESFCYWLETKLMELGKIKGGTTADKKFGVYYGQTKYDKRRKYRTIPKWDKELDPFRAFENIKNEIYSLLQSGELLDYDEINKNRISPMFKGKILSTYFPEDYLTIFSDKHLDYFMEVLPIKYNISEKIRLIDKQNILLDFKNNNSTLMEWSNDQFSRFLYTTYNPRNDENQDYRSSKKLVEFIELDYLGKKSEKKPKFGKQDYVEKGKRNQEIGLIGERIVFSNEINRLKNEGLRDLASKVDHVSLNDDSLGYDIQSFDIMGNEIHIEVKSTTALPNKVHFYITHNELIKARDKENHFIYLVYDVKSNNPKIHILDKSILNHDNLEPINYRINLKAKVK